MNWKEVSKTKDLNVVRTAAAELDVNERDERGRTPLMLFLTNRMPVHAIEVLIEQGAALELEDKLGDTALKKAIKFKQPDAIMKLIEAGAKLDSPRGILATAWNAARGDNRLADLLLDTKGAVRLTLTAQEEETVDEILYEESLSMMSKKIRLLDSPVLLHAVVNGYNWDDGSEPMLAAFQNPAILEITLLDMYELLEGDYWLEKDESKLQKSTEGMRWKELAVGLKGRLEQTLAN
ncbi:DUF4274 domain-containing protein [Paenibacillus sp. ACRRX]|uniref:DUF4274 domain-containing protein n=1 Tax=unclassified Paenibacillus TaxID=185978 RepID=UPI001EF3E000|nr:DUF4274 domain-containing protein [Paenibacillus sp. UMB4589-SE434]MCG7407097.1 DUF4274 domain-containing protein [Paenibacillus sp. ACRRX]MDK8180317.1 DUF4274 domain-containing protein [Paenibacillus sp. UMB4589-SE434]